MTKKKEGKKEDEQSWNYCLVFSTLLKVSGSFVVDLLIEYQRDIVYKLLALLCFVFLGAAPIPYQACQVACIARVTHPLDQFHKLTCTRQAISCILCTGPYSYCPINSLNKTIGIEYKISCVVGLIPRLAITASCPGCMTVAVCVLSFCSKYWVCANQLAMCIN